MKTFYKFAGVELSLSIPEKWMYENERTLEGFRVEALENPFEFQFEIVDQLLDPFGELAAIYPDYRVYRNDEGTVRYMGVVKDSWENAYMRISNCGEKYDVQLKASRYITGISTKTVLNALGVEHLTVETQGIVLHASYINYQGQGILFTAPSGTGKSTQADLWSNYRGAEIVNGDRAVMQIADEKILACGIPFAGSSQHCKNVTLPLVAIVYLGQSMQTEIKRLSGVEAFRKVWEGCSVAIWNKDDTEKALTTVKGIVEKVPVFYLSCTPDESAVIALEQELGKIKTGIERSGK